VTRRLPSNEFDVLIVVEGNNLLARKLIEKVLIWSPTFN
jgi:hypothetical protein